MTWIQQKLKKWLGILEMEYEIDRLHQMASGLEMECGQLRELSRKQAQMDFPNNSDKDVPMQDTPDAHLGAF